MTMSPAHKVRLGVLLSLFVLTGCGTARVVSRDASGGVVAIPENSNYWPTSYRDKAMALIKKDCPDAVIVREEEVVIGKVTTDRQDTETSTRDLNKRVGGTLTTTDTTRTKESHDQTEWRITYRKPSPPTTLVQTAPGPMPPRTIQPAAAMTPAAAVAPGAAGLPPQPTPVGQ
jgi:hypothetical protein